MGGRLALWIVSIHEASRTGGVSAGSNLELAAAGLAGTDKEQIQDILHRAAVRSEGTRLARDLVNDSPELLNPEAFVELVCGRWKEQPVQIQVYRGQELAERQMNGLLAVGAGSRHEPALIEITYRHAPDPDELPIALVGKGITFDMGGMNVKTGRDISDARMDMGVRRQ